MSRLVTRPRCRSPSARPTRSRARRRSCGRAAKTSCEDAPRASARCPTRAGADGACRRRRRRLDAAGTAAAGRRQLRDAAGASARRGADGAAARQRRRRAAPTSVSRRATTVCTRTVCPSLTRISASVPALGDGISASTLSVEISKIGSSRLTASPTFFSHLRDCPFGDRLAHLGHDHIYACHRHTPSLSSVEPSSWPPRRPQCLPRPPLQTPQHQRRQRHRANQPSPPCKRLPIARRKSDRSWQCVAEL